MGEPTWQNTIRRFLDTLFHELVNLVVLNLLFVVSCLPVVTLGPALAALSRAAAEVATGRCAHPARTYWTYFRTRLSLTLPLGLGLLALAGAMVFSFFFYSRMAAESLMAIPLVSLSILGLLILVGVSIHLLPILTVGAESPLSLLQEAAHRALARFPGTLIATLLILVLLAAQVLTFPMSIPLTLTVGFSVPALVGGFLQPADPDAEV